MQVKSLLVKIGAETKEFDSAMERSQASMNKVGKTMVIAGAAIVAAFGAMIVKTAKTGDQYDKLSQRIGVSVEMLSGYAHAADLGGASVETFGKGIAKLSNNMVEAYQKGVGPAAESFETLGISVADSSGKLKSSEEIMLEIADRFAGMEDGALKTAMAMDLLGKGGVELIPVLNLGSAGLKAQREEADRLGTTMSTSAAKACADLVDAQTRLKASLQGVGQQIAMNLIPAISPLIEKMASTIAKVSTWVKENQAIAGAIAKVSLAIGVFLMGGGAVLMILPKLIAGMKLLGIAKMGLLGPMGLVAAALAAAAVGFMVLKDAHAALDAASKRYEDANERLMQKLYKARDAAGYTEEAFERLIKKYNGSAMALARAIREGKEGITIQMGLAAASKEQAAGIEEQIRALEAAAKAQADKIILEQAACASMEAMKQLRIALTDEIAKASMTEAAYTLWSLDQQYQARRADIQKSAAAEKEKNALLLLAKGSYLQQVSNMETVHYQAVLTARTAFEQQWRDKEWQIAGERGAALVSYFEQKKTLEDGINQLTMSTLAYTLWALEQERLAKETAILAEKEMSTLHQEELLAKNTEYYERKKELAEADASGLIEITNLVAQAIGGIYEDLWGNVLDGFQKWGEGSMSLLDAVGQAFKDTAQNAISAIKSMLAASARAAIQDIINQKAIAIAGVIAQVIKSIPFPLNLAVVGGAIAGVSALFGAIKLGEGGLVDRPTLALIGEKGPELVTPLDKLGQLVGAGGGVNVRVTAHFYGDLKTDYSLDEISEALSLKITRSIQRGRRL